MSSLATNPTNETSNPKEKKYGMIAQATFGLIARVCGQ